MTVFVIAGKIDCVHFAHASFVAEHLTNHLPSVKVNKIQKLADEWPNWLKQINTQNKWSHTKSPLIWKELSRIGGKAYLIGGLSEFWEYCYDYYNLQSFLRKSDLIKLVADNLFAYEHLLSQNSSKNFVASVLGGSSTFVDFLLNELQNLQINQKIIIRLLSSTKNKQLFYSNDEPNITNVSNLQEAITDCDLLIVLEDEERLENQTLNDWLIKRYIYHKLLSDRINTFANRNLRIIVSNSGPVCFDASILVTYCTSIRIANIVAITTDVGYTALNLISKLVDVKIEEMSAPPVWGFVGIKSIVDTKNIIIKSNVYQPYLRAVTSQKGSTLSLGTNKTELRTLSYIFEDNLDEEINERITDIKNCLKRPPIFPKIRAIGSLLKLWFASGVVQDNIISLGVCSNGSFGFRSGIVISQPVILNEEKRIWQPFPDYPISNETKEKVFKQLKSLDDLFKDFGIGQDLDNSFNHTIIDESFEILLEKFINTDSLRDDDN